MIEGEEVGQGQGIEDVTTEIEIGIGNTAEDQGSTLY